ncbi:MAG: tetraacyldisaccharide 4'-kinase [Pseudomonadota bacterium]|nr:tetraacyldisaccharide 4'-kinase [Pseudomonadota bacterium]MEC9190182.1 tetraacyldisaccharide 4'-kinase [Pseudomonadota bacterium]
MSKYTENYFFSFNKIKILNIILLPLSLIYYVFFILRKNYLLTNSYKTSKYLIVIGNITVGGTGKTSFTIWLANYIENTLNKKVAIISHGYGSKFPKKLSEVTNNSSLLDVGDESLIIRRNTNAKIYKCKDRLKAYKYIEDKLNIDYVIMDDGLQHYKIKPNLSICLAKEKNSFGNGLLLPAGPLREPIKNIKKFDILLYKKVRNSKEDYGFTYKADKLINLKNGKSQNIKDYSGKVFHLILTISDSYFVEEVLKDNNIKYISHFYPDHFNINDTMLEFDDNYDILLTEKELVKITNMENTKIFYIPTEISVDEKIQNDINLKLNY